MPDEKEETRKFCPMTFASFTQYCAKEKCQWWTVYRLEKSEYGECIIQALASLIYMIK